MTPGVPDVPQRRKRDAARTREEILRAARARFARSGYSHVTLKDIADDAGITPALIVRYFESKAKLYNEVVRTPANLLPAPGERVDLAEFARSVLRHWSNADANASTLSFLRSLDLDDGQLFEEEIDRRFRLEWLDRLEGEDADIRSRLIIGVSFGVGLFSVGALLPGYVATDDDLARMQPYLEALYRVCVDPDRSHTEG